MTRQAERGFGLLDAIIAFAVLAVVLGAVFALIAPSLRAIRTARWETAALALADARLTEAGWVEPLTPGSSEGGRGDDLAWRRTIEPLPLPAVSGQRLLRVTVTVSGPGGRQLELSSLRLAPQP